MTTGDDAASSTLASTWKDQRVWSNLANDTKAKYDRARGVVLCLALLGAGLETLASQADTIGVAFMATPLMYAGAVALAFVPVLTRLYLGRTRMLVWVEARTISEALKSEIFKYQTRTKPYAGGDRDAVLRARRTRIAAGKPDLDERRAGRTADDRSMPPLMDEAAYLENRLEQQLEGYYRPRAETHATSARRYRLWLDVLALTAAALGVVAALSQGGGAIAAWVAVLTTAATALTAHVAATRYEELAATFTATADRLEDLRDVYRDGIEVDGETLTLAGLVSRCEQIITTENGAWRADWLGRPSHQPLTVQRDEQAGSNARQGA